MPNFGGPNRVLGTKIKGKKAEIGPSIRPLTPQVAVVYVEVQQSRTQNLRRSWSM